LRYYAWVEPPLGSLHRLLRLLRYNLPQPPMGYFLSIKFSF
jgi:hypothetical protein